MAMQTIGVGSSANDGTGDAPRTAGQKINANFTELYGALNRIAWPVNQPGHSFSLLTVVRPHAGDWVAAQANAASTPGYAVVIEIVDADNVVLAQSGRHEVIGHGKTTDTLLYLSPTSAGDLTTIEPVDPDIPQPVIYVENSSTLLILPYKPGGSASGGGGSDSVVYALADPTKTTNPSSKELIWVNTVSGNRFTCIDNTANDNIWVGLDALPMVPTPPSDNLWFLQGDMSGTTLSDASGNSNDLTVSGGYQSESVKDMSSLHHDGSNNSSGPTITLAGDLCISLWCSLETITSVKRVLAIGTWTSVGSLLMYADYGNLTVGISSPSDTQASKHTKQRPNDWTHLAVNRVGTSMQCVINGEIADTATIGTDDVTGTLTIGDNTDSFAGSLAGLRIYERSLSVTELKALYNEGRPETAKYEYKSGSVDQLRVGLVTKVDGTVDGSGNPIDVHGGFTYTKVGGLTTAVETSGPLVNRDVFVLNGTDSQALCEDTEETRIVGDVTVAGWWFVDPSTDFSTSDRLLIDCSITGESLETNANYSFKHDDGQTTPGSIYSFQEYGAGSNCGSIGDSLISAAAAKGVWMFIAISKRGKDILASTYKNDTWYHEADSIFHVSEKADTANTQILSLFAAQDASSPYYGKCAGVGVWSRHMSRKERIDLMNSFFEL